MLIRKNEFRFDHAWLQHEMSARNLHLDAGETAMLARQLEHVYAQMFEMKLPVLKARQLFPVDTSVNPGAETYTYRMWEAIGMAKIIANYAADFPNVDVLAREYPAPIKSIGDCYRYSIQDLRAAAMAGVSLDIGRARAARRALEQLLDYVAAFGDTATGLPGGLNNANIPFASLAHAPWVSASALEIVEDLNSIAALVVSQSGEVHIPDTMILDSASFGLILSKPMSTTGDSNLTVLKFFLQNNPYIKQVDSWVRCNDAGAEGVTRGLCYLRDPEIVQLVVPQDFEQFPPQAKNMAFEIPCHMRLGGVCWRYPMAAVYFDGSGEPEGN